ncbi:CoA transferase [Mesorhizobium sp.]|uniref:CaiB/BaiF CoA transferase family protein n=1 Tax=Mesorhizobium sp. TaxID=1871066 RepID=UPI0025BB74C9|nr:CoA transferase [Mesorhizobium sp.]
MEGVRVIEVADELGEYCGRVLAGLGADVVKVEPRGGDITRTYGPFYEDVPGPERSLYFWQYNLGKRSVELDLDTPKGQASFLQLAKAADVVIDTRPRDWMNSRGLGYPDLAKINDRLIYARVSAFGDDGPWADFKGSDLIHLALGGVMMNCGYDCNPLGEYETPPIAPQMWHSYHIAGEMMVMSILAALVYRLRSGQGQLLSSSVHAAVSANTETDVPDWIFLRQPHYRQTCRHSTMKTNSPALARTKDGRWVLPYTTYLKGYIDALPPTTEMLKRYGMELDLEDPKYNDPDVRKTLAFSVHFGAAIERLVGAFMYDRELWREAQDKGLPWAAVRRPEENIDDQHWIVRNTFLWVEHPEIAKSLPYAVSRWVAPGIPWKTGTRAPLPGEHTSEVLAEWSPPAGNPPTRKKESADEPLSVHRKPFPLRGIRVVDLSWALASAGSGRYLAAFGADVIKVEHESRWDGMRWSLGTFPEGGRAARDAAREPLPTPVWDSPNCGGAFMEINAGKRAIALDLKSKEGRETLEELIRTADVIVEGFSPGTMDRMGFGYERLRELNPKIIYAQQSGLGQAGTYGRARTFGPTAQALTGLSDMSGLPDPFQPAGIGYSYLDWFGAYNLATAMTAAIYRRDVTGEGCWIDSSQAETGLYLTGTSILDHAANGRSWQRFGNRSPYKLAAPHGAFRLRGDDRWIAIACFNQTEWNSLIAVLGSPDWAADEKFSTLAARLANQEELERLIDAETATWDGFMLMAELQARGVPAGVCQTAEDRCEHDPQLDHLNWLVELNQAEIGRWPVRDHPVKFEKSPAYIGGLYNRSGPNYGQDTVEVLNELSDQLKHRNNA